MDTIRSRFGPLDLRINESLTSQPGFEGMQVMKWVGMAAAAVAGLCVAGSAQATVIYDVTLTGTITSQTAPGPDTDPNLAVGDTITLTAQFSSAYTVQWGSDGYTVAGLYGLYPTGDQYFRVDAPGLSWSGFDNLDDFDDPFFNFGGTGLLGVPGIAFADGKVLGVAGYLIGAGGGGPAGAPFSSKPNLSLGSTPGSGEAPDPNGPFPDDPTMFTPWTFGDEFSLDDTSYYDNAYISPGFTGVWDFADSVVTESDVPEPAAWVMLIFGIGAIGIALRRMVGRPNTHSAA